MKTLMPFMLFPILILGMVCRAQTPQKGTVKAGALLLYYERTGKGKALVLLHAGLQDHTMWQSQVKALSASYDVITPDLPVYTGAGPAGHRWGRS